MLKVIIVDDEMLVRVGIKSTIAWEEHGFSVVAEASNGDEALQKIRELHPDILLTDIRMPKMDGIALLRQIELEQLPIESVIMSCYNEFELVRSAMQYGASDYLLKLSFTEDDLLAVLERIKKKILSQRGQSALSPQLGNRIHEEQLIRLLLDGGEAPEQLDRIAKSLNLCVRFSAPAFLILSADPLFCTQTMDYTPIDQQTYQLILNMIHDHLTGRLYGEILPLKAYDNYFLIILNPGLELSRIACSITERLRAYLKLSFSIGILDYAPCGADGPRLRRSVSVFTDLRYVRGPGKIFSLTAQTPQPPQHRPRLKAMHWLADIHGIADFPKLPEIIHALSQQMALQQLSREACQQIFNEVFYQLCSFFQAYGGNINGLNEMCGFSMAERIHKLQFLSDAEAWFHSFAILGERYWQECCRQWKRGDILSAIYFTQNNYAKQISSNTVATEVGISTAYFSTLFKQETGRSFTEYLTELRMEKAKQLLEDRSIYIYEIGERVGYPDANYFCKVFKRYTGLSPESYRKSRSG